MKFIKNILIILLLLNVGISTGIAQETVNVPDTTQTDSKILKLLVKAKEMIDVYNSVMTPELLTEIANFQNETGVNIYAKPRMENDSTTFAKVLNSIVDVKYQNLQAPYITFKIAFTREQAVYTASIVAEGSNDMQQTVDLLNSTLLIDLNIFLQNFSIKDPELGKGLKKVIGSLRGAKQIQMHVPYTVQFSIPQNHTFGFDDAFKQEFINEYERITVNKQDYNVAWQSLQTNQLDNIKVNFVATGDTIIAGFTTDSILFRKNSTRTNINKTIQGNDTILSIQGAPSDGEDEIDAYYILRNDSGETQEVLLGQLGIVTYEPQNFEVVLVPINGATIPSASTVQTELNRIYKKAVTNFTVSSVGNIDIPNFASGFNNTDSDDRMNYTADMNTAIDALTSVDNNKYYLFFISNPTDASIDGYMPYKKHFGFIFNNSIHTIAHELGHGIFRLRHTFVDYPSITRATTDNLMDYNNGENLYKYQWDYIHNPQWSFNWLYDESEGESDNVKLEQLLTWIKNNHNTNVSYNKSQFFTSSSFLDYPLHTIVNGKDITVYVELENSGTVDINKNIGINVNPTLQYHTGFYISFKYSGSNSSAIKIWTYKYEDFVLLLSKIGFKISQKGRKKITQQYISAIDNVENDCDDIDVIYETIPDFVLDTISDEILYDHLKMLSNCNMSENSWAWGGDTDEELAAIKILRGVNNKLTFYTKLTSDFTLVKRLYEKINGSERELFIYALQDIIITNWTINNINSDNFLTNGNSQNYTFFWNTKIRNVGRFSSSGNTIELWGALVSGGIASTVSFIPPKISISPFDPVLIVWATDPNSSFNESSLVPAIYLKWMADEKNFDDGLQAIQIFSNFVGIYGAGKLLITGTTKLAMFIALLEGANIITDVVVNNLSVKTSLRESSLGRDFLDVWPYISIAADIATVSVSDLNKFINSSSAAKQTLNNFGFNNEANKLDELVLEARKILANGGDGLVRGVSKSVFKSSFTASEEIAEQAWTFFKNEDWTSLENLFNTHNINKYNGIVYPPNNGAINYVKRTLDPSDFNGNLIIDRYGSPTGKFTSPVNTPFPQRALPLSYAGQTPQKYKVLKPIPNVEEGQIIPWFGQPGLGIQYKLEKSVQYYINEGYLLPIP